MKKIVAISIDNYKAYIQQQIIRLPKGENLLIYGENGSGKSSLFNALKHFLKSSVDSSIPFDLNVFSSRLEGKIELTFKDYDDATSQPIEGSEISYQACETPANSTNSVSFIKLSHRYSGFLDYSQLLSVYLNQGSRPNLFELINDLIGDYVPTSYGFSESLKDIFDSVHNLMKNSYQRSNRTYIQGKIKFSRLLAVYTQIINDLDIELNSLMTNYFSDFKLGLHLVDTKISIDESHLIRDTKIDGSIFIEVTHHGTVLNEYNTRLNEARLSAIAVCLYLASLKLRNKNADIKLLHLDDVFIGLDSANRRPILNMIEKEFSDYQIFISTYDKSWYRLAMEILNDTNRWKYMEFYEGVTNIGAHRVVRPIIVEERSFIDKAKAYLYDEVDPDYPAAANYMRKAFEEVLSKNMYSPATKDDNLENVPGYKIIILINKSRTFLSSLTQDPYSTKILKLLDELTTFLKPMLHPLSHYAPGEPVYKQELSETLAIYEKLVENLEEADYGNRLTPILTRDSKLKFRISGPNWDQEYSLTADYDLYSYLNAVGDTVLSICPVRATEIKETDKTTSKVSRLTITNGSRNKSSFEYKDINDCFTKITSYLSSPQEGKGDYIVPPQITDMFFLPDINPAPNSKIEYNEPLTKFL